MTAEDDLLQFFNILITPLGRGLGLWISQLGRGHDLQCPMVAEKKRKLGGMRGCGNVSGDENQPS